MAYSDFLVTLQQFNNESAEATNVVPIISNGIIGFSLWEILGRLIRQKTEQEVI